MFADRQIDTTQNFFSNFLTKYEKTISEITKNEINI